MRQEGSSLALAAARAGLADAEDHIQAAETELRQLPEVDTPDRRAVQGRLSYYGQIATRYRTEIARLLRG